MLSTLSVWGIGINIKLFGETPPHRSKGKGRDRKGGREQTGREKGRDVPGRGEGKGQDRKEKKREMG